MKIVADENIDKGIVDRLRADGHDVLYTADAESGIDDHGVLGRSLQTDGVRLTADKDFGDLVFRQRLLHAGVLLVRLAGIKPELKAGLVTAAFEHHAEQLGSGFAVLSPRMASCPVHRLTRAFGSPTLSGRLWARSGLHHSVERFLVPMSTKARGIWPSVWIWPRKLDVLR